MRKIHAPAPPSKKTAQKTNASASAVKKDKIDS